MDPSGPSCCRWRSPSAHTPPAAVFPADFSIWTREAGAGGLSIAMEGPSRAEISFDDRKDGSCGVSYVAQEPGRAQPSRPPPTATASSARPLRHSSLSDFLVGRRLRDLGQVQRAAHPRQPLPGAGGGARQRRPPPHCYRPSGEARGDTSTAGQPCFAQGLQGAVA